MEKKKLIHAWIKSELESYIRECGSDYKEYLIEDVVSEFSLEEDSEEFKEEIAELARKIIKGDDY